MARASLDRWRVAVEPFAGVGFQIVARPARSQVKVQTREQPSPHDLLGHLGRPHARAPGEKRRGFLQSRGKSQEASKLNRQREQKAPKNNTHGEHRCPTGLALHLPRPVDQTSAPAARLRDDGEGAPGAKPPNITSNLFVFFVCFYLIDKDKIASQSSSAANSNT